MNRTSVLIDGLNLYHSLLDIGSDRNVDHILWLDVKKVCSSFLVRSMQAADGERATLADILYYYALPFHRGEDAVRRHRTYVSCLKATGVACELARFKPKYVKCSKCSHTFKKWEEKETDVAICVKLLEILHMDAADTVIIASGDTDLAPAVRTATRLYPMKRVFFCFPYRRKNQELQQLAPQSFNLRPKVCINSQLPERYPLPDGSFLERPATW